MKVDWGGDRGDMEIPDVGWCLGSLCHRASWKGLGANEEGLGANREGF